MKSLQPKRGNRYGERGFTIIELLVVLVIFTIVTGAIYGLLEVARTSRNRSNNRSDVLKNARLAIHLIGRDAFNAGLGYNSVGGLSADNTLARIIGTPPDVDTDRDVITSIMVADQLYPNSISLVPGTRTDSVAFCFRDMEYFQNELVNISAIGNSGSPAIPRVTASAPILGGPPLNAVEPKVHDLYLIESDRSQVAIMATNIAGNNRVDAQQGDPLGINQQLNAAGSAQSALRTCASSADTNCMDLSTTTLKKFHIVSYKVTPDGTLVRTKIGNNSTGAVPADQKVEQPLAYNVENLQLSYVLEDGTVTDAPNAVQVNAIRQITVTITVQATSSAGQGQRRDSLTYSATFSARNMKYIAG